MKRNKVLNLGLIAGLLISLAFVAGCIPTGDGEEAGFDPTIIIFLVLFTFGVKNSQSV